MQRRVYRVQAVAVPGNTDGCDLVRGDTRTVHTGSDYTAGRGPGCFHVPLGPPRVGTGNVPLLRGVGHLVALVIEEHCLNHCVARVYPEQVLAHRSPTSLAAGQDVNFPAAAGPELGDRLVEIG